MNRRVAPLAAALALSFAGREAVAAPARTLVVTDQCFLICPLIPPPLPTRVGEPHGVTVLALDEMDQPDAGYTGTVVFTSSDASADLPAPYTFTAADGGVRFFEVTLRGPGPETVRVADTAGNLVPASLTRNVVASKAVPALSQVGFPVAASPVRGLASGPDGNVWFSAGGGPSGIGPNTPNEIGRLTPDGTRTDFDPAAPFVGGIVTGSDRNLWFASAGDGFSQPGRIGRITPTGTVTLFPVPLSRSAPQDVALGSDGNVWFTEATGSIGRITPAGAITLYPVPTAGAVPFHIVSGPDGALWFTETGSRIGRIDVSGMIQEFPVPSSPSSPWGIASGADGNLWFTEAGASRIGHVRPDGAIVEYDVPGGGVGYGIGAGPDGAIWFETPGSIVRVAQDYFGAPPTFQRFSIPSGPGSTPFRVITGPDNNLWFGDFGRVVRATISDCGSGGSVCLDGRFRARVDFRSGAAGPSFPATAIPRTPNVGYFWFFSPNNLEVAVKLVDGRAFNGHYWVFVGSLTNVEFTVTVTDTMTGDAKTYSNSPGQLASVADVSAF